MRGFVKGLFLFTLGLLIGATIADRMRERTSDRTRRMFVAMDVQRARDLAARGDLAGAREAWIRVNLIHPDSFDAHMGLGFFYGCAGEWDSAARQYERAIESYAAASDVDLYAPQPQDLAVAHARLGRVSARQGREEKARRGFDEAIGMGVSLSPALRGRLGTRAGWMDYLDRLDRGCPQKILGEGKPARKG